MLFSSVKTYTSWREKCVAWAIVRAVGTTRYNCYSSGLKRVAYDCDQSHPARSNPPRTPLKSSPCRANRELWHYDFPIPITIQHVDSIVLVDTCIIRDARHWSYLLRVRKRAFITSSFPSLSEVYWDLWTHGNNPCVQILWTYIESYSFLLSRPYSFMPDCQ